MSNAVQSESSLRILLKIPDSVLCCVSCHDEFDRGISSPENIEIDEVTYFCCCRIHEHATNLLSMKAE